MRARLGLFITIIQLILFAAHAFVYGTCVYFFGPLTAPSISALRIAFALLSISFVTGSVLAFRFSNAIVRTYYIVAAAWLGTFNFLALSSCACWLAYGVSSLLGFHPNRHTLGVIFLAVALVASVYGLINAAVIRITRIPVTLENLPAAWRGRTAALVSDVHLGHVRNLGFVRRIAKMVAELKPEFSSLRAICMTALPPTSMASLLRGVLSRRRSANISYWGITRVSPPPPVISTLSQAPASAS